MSLCSNIDHLAIAHGIDGVAVASPLGDRDYRGPEPWRPILDRSLNLLAMTSEPTIRLVIGKHTVVVQKEGDETVAVLLPTGHAIAKSLRRMIRRMAKKDRGPLQAPQPQPSSVTAPGIARPATSSPTFPWEAGR